MNASGGNNRSEHSDDLNLELSALDQEVYFPSADLNANQASALDCSNNNNNWSQVATQYTEQTTAIDFMTQTNLDFEAGVASSCQTDEFYFSQNLNTNSTQTQTKHEFYGDIGGVVDTITQTDCSGIYCLDKNL